jgi:hypothetical protein
MSQTNGIGQSADLAAINAIEVVQALKGDESVAYRLRELEHDFYRIE